MFYKLKTNTREGRKTALEYICKMQREGVEVEGEGGDGGGRKGAMQPCRYGLTAEVGDFMLFIYYFPTLKYFYPEIFHPGEKFLVRSLQKFALN
jgi:hypothetical protein